MHRTRHYPFRSNSAPRQMIDEAILRTIHQPLYRSTLGPRGLTGGPASRVAVDSFSFVLVGPG
jgi:hypothetical protein